MCLLAKKNIGIIAAGVAAAIVIGLAAYAITNQDTVKPDLTPVDTAPDNTARINI